MPSRDYPSPIGPLYAAMHGLMLRFNDLDARSVIRADVVMLLVDCLLLWPLRRGLPKTSQAIIFVLLAAMMLTPLALDSTWGSYRYVADYNRWAWGFFAVSLIWTCNAEARGVASQIAVGIALCCLFYLKLTLFAGASLCLMLGWLRGRRLGDYLVPGMMLILAIGCGLVTGFLLPYLRDNIEIGHATASLRWGKLIVQIADPYNVVPTLLALALCCARTLPGRLRLLLGASVALLHLTALQNFDVMVPLIGWPLLLLAPELARANVTWFRPFLAWAPAGIQAVGLYMVVAVAFVWQGHIAISLNAKSMGPIGTFGERISMSTEAALGHGIGAGDLDYADDVIYRQIGSAGDLLSPLPAGTRVATLETANIAIIAWPRLHPAPRAALWYGYQRSFSEHSYPAPRQAFGGADVILVPRHFTTDSTQRLVALYQPWLDRCATVTASNDLWQLYRPISAATSSGSVSDVPPASMPNADDCQILAKP
jgi:hypothetical protein